MKIKNRLTTKTTAATAAVASPSAEIKAEGQFPLEYEGIKYEDLARQWLKNEGVFGEVVHSKRNQTLFCMAAEFRYICDFNEAWLKQILAPIIPTHNVDATIRSALGRVRGSELPEKLVRAIKQCKEAATDEEELYADAANPLPRHLPKVFGMVARKHSQNANAAVLASLPMLGTLCSNLRATYMDGWTEMSPIFFTIISAPQATGKSFVRNLDEQLMRPLKQHDALQREALLEYQQELKAAKNKAKQPEPPETDIRIVPLKNSNAIFLKRMVEAHGLSLYSFGEELDTLRKAQKGGSWSEKGDLIRLAFDSAEFGQDYMSENSYSGVCAARWNLVMCGTLGAVNRFFTDVEDGMMSRFCFAEMRDNRGKKLTRRRKPNALMEKALDVEVERLYGLYSMNETATVRIPKTEEALSAWEDAKIALYIANPANNALDILRRRAMVMGFRAAMLAWATEGGKETACIPEFAVWVAEEVLRQQLSLFGDKLNESVNEEIEIKNTMLANKRRDKTTDFLSQLANEFSSRDLDMLRVQYGYKSKSGWYLHQWTQNGIIEPVEGKRGWYRKLVS